MKRRDSDLLLSATDLSNHLACRHLATLDRALARGEIPAPTFFDPRNAILRERGIEHEQAYLASLLASGVEVVELPTVGDRESLLAATREAMGRGVGGVAQASLADGRWHGRADVLLRVERPSALGAWSYVPIDAKLARETRGGSILQLIVYAELLAALQGVVPDWVGVVTPERGFVPERYRVAEFRAFAARVRRRLEESVDGTEPTYPLPNPHCDACLWWGSCDARWRRDDHLCLVAGIRRAHERELATRGVSTLAAFAALPIPLAEPPSRGSAETLERLREQARVQLASRTAGAVIWERRPIEASGQGLARLPEPSPGDVFLDLEGDPFVGEAGLEFLFGTVTLGADGEPEYRARFAFDRESERAAFESLMDEIAERRERHPGLHVYHFGVYEPAALKRLMGRYATREDALDRLLRGERFVDLHRVLTQAVRVGVESYSLKQIEPLYGFARALPLAEASRALREVEAALELGRAGDVGDEARARVARYNHDDCSSARGLRDWLEGLRAEALCEGHDLPRPAPEIEEPSERLSEWQGRVRPVVERLLDGLPADPTTHSAEQRGRWLLAHALDFHRREDKVAWWEYFRLAELSEEERFDEPKAIAGLRFVRRIPPEGRGQIPADEYSFPPQEVDRRAKGVKVDGGRSLGTILDLDPTAGRVTIKKMKATIDAHPTSVFLYDKVDCGVIEGSLLRLAEWVADHGIDAPGAHRTARDLLLGRPPRGCASVDGSLARVGEDVVSSARRLALELDHGVLPLQGPPGAGKTYTGARMIVELVRRGRKVGVAAVSHKVIENLVRAALSAADAEGVPLRCIRKGKDGSEASTDPRLLDTTKNEEIVAALGGSEVQVAAGTAWLWSRPDLADAVDVLFVDEAGQMALADVVAVAQAAKSLVLLGDPQQLEQPIQASHPDGTAVAALTHLLAGRQTIEADRGLFLEQTWRLHPEICAFTSEQFYEGRLRSREGLERQALHAPAPFARSGLYFLPVEHEGNQSASDEEAVAVADLVRGWLEAGAEWTDHQGNRARLGPQDILVVVPYNAQIGRIEKLLPGVRVGTVDKFQGQEAPVVIYSMVTSSPEEAPRGLEFLYSRNRLNVATSRARCAAVLVASPRLLEPECRTPRHLRLANALCRYVEMARAVPGGAR